MLSDLLLEKINSQINFEFYSAYTYLAMSAYAESVDLSGFANFFKIQAEEELFHAMKLYNYVFQKNGFVNLEAIEKPNKQYSDIIDAFEKGYPHEQIVTKRIYEIADIAHEEKEHATMSLLRWFIDEQVEEENNFSSLLKKVRRCKDNPAALYMMDDELATREFTPPAN